MSVQAGIWNFNGQAVEGKSLVDISETVAEYGCDGESTYLHGPVGMVYRALHTTLESRMEHQPHVSVRGKVITWDGRLDNRDELISELARDLTGEQTDVAIFAAAFEKWDCDAFRKITGDWAVSIWDPFENKLVLARDYIGVKRLFYYCQGTRIIWCSYLGPLASCGDKFNLCEEYIANYLAGRLAAHLTPYREIHPVPPGTFVRIHNANASVHPYWSFNSRHRTRYQTDGEYEEHFRYLFRQAVRRRLRSDSPVLAELSGGYDSSSIVCTADDILAKEGAGTPSLDTFSYSYLDEPDADDCLYFSKVEERRGRIGHHAQVRGSGDTFSLTYPTFVALPVLGMRKEVEIARSEVLSSGKYRVTLSGVGGDEFMGQQLDPRMQIAESFALFRLRRFVTQLADWSLLMRRPWIQLLFESLCLLLPNSIRARVTEEAKVERWVNKEFARKHSLSTLLLQISDGPWRWLPSARGFHEAHRTFAGLLTNLPPALDETRYPYLDQTLTEFLTSIPMDQLHRPGERRSLMRRALQGILPKEILSRRTKQLESRCYVITLAKHWEALKSVLTCPLSAHLGYIKASELETALLAVKHGQMPGTAMLLLRGLFLELWLRETARRNVISIPSSPASTIRTDSRPGRVRRAPLSEGRCTRRSFEVITSFC
jgi:asparagine synthase (glutamine-hydrolysing)